MIINMKPDATETEIDHVIDRIRECGYQEHVIRGAERTVIGAVGSNGRRNEIEALLAAPGVEALVPIAHPFKLVSRQLKHSYTVIDIRGVKIGGGGLVGMAWPCSGESRGQLIEDAAGGQA